MQIAAHFFCIIEEIKKCEKYLQRDTVVDHIRTNNGRSIYYEFTSQTTAEQKELDESNAGEVRRFPPSYWKGRRV